MHEKNEGEPTPEELNEIPSLDQFTLLYATRIIDLEIFDSDATDSQQVDALLKVVDDEKSDPALREEAIDRIYEIFKQNEDRSGTLNRIIQKLNIDNL